MIVPVYNTEKYVGRCIESVQRQTYRKWELLLVDDGSTDGSGRVCEKYAAGDSRIRVFHNKNQGPAACRADGVKHANGSLIMFVDSDDWIDGSMLEVMKAQMDETGAGIVCCSSKDISDNGKEHIQKHSDRNIDCKTAEQCMYQMHHTRLLTGSPWGKLFQRKLFDGINFCRNVTIGEDYAMIVQLAEKAAAVRIVPEIFYFRYVRRGSISHGGFTERHREAFDNYMRIRLDLLSKYPDLGPDIIAFHTEYEMAVITAMCRNDCYDTQVIDKLKKDLCKNMKNTMQNPKIPLYMKGCALLIAYMHPVFVFLFRILHRLTGR